MNDLTRRQLEMERRVYRLEDLADKELARSNAAMMAAQYLGNVLTLEWTPPPPFVWKIKTLKAQALFDTPAVRYSQAYWATLQGSPLGSINYFNLHDGKVFEEMRREKSHMVASSSLSSAAWGHLNGERATDATDPLNPVKDLTVWPWPFDPNTTQPGVNWPNVWYATYLNDPAPDWFTMGGSSAGWPPSQPLRPVGWPTIDWFGAGPQNTYSTQYGVAPREQYLYSTGGITPSYQSVNHTVTWSHGNLYQPIEWSGSSNVSWGDTSRLPANAFCGKIGALDKIASNGGRTFYRAGAAVYFNAHAIPAGTLWQGGPGTVTIPATFIMLEIDPYFLEVPTAFTSPASVKLTWT